MRKRYFVGLAWGEKDHLHELVSAGRGQARKLAHARILLKANEGWTDKSIHQALDVSMPTVARVRRRFAEEGCKLPSTAVLPTGSTDGSWTAAAKHI